MDQVLLWTKLSAQERASIVAEYHAEGIFITVSAFGSTDTPTTDGIDPVAAAESMADFVVEFNLDGIDVDYEDSVALANGEAVGWLISFTETLRANLPTGFIMTHARKPSLSLSGYIYINYSICSPSTALRTHFSAWRLLSGRCSCRRVDRPLPCSILQP